MIFNAIYTTTQLVATLLLVGSCYATFPYINIATIYLYTKISKCLPSLRRDKGKKENKVSLCLRTNFVID